MALDEQNSTDLAELSANVTMYRQQLEEVEQIVQAEPLNAEALEVMRILPFSGVRTQATATAISYQLTAIGYVVHTLLYRVYSIDSGKHPPHHLAAHGTGLWVFENADGVAGSE